MAMEYSVGIGAFETRSTTVMTETGGYCVNQWVWGRYVVCVGQHIIQFEVECEDCPDLYHLIQTGGLVTYRHLLANYEYFTIQDTDALLSKPASYRYEVVDQCDEEAMMKMLVRWTCDEVERLDTASVETVDDRTPECVRTAYEEMEFNAAIGDHIPRIASHGQHVMWMAKVLHDVEWL